MLSQIGSVYYKWDRYLEHCHSDWGIILVMSGPSKCRCWSVLIIYFLSIAPVLLWSVCNAAGTMWRGCLFFGFVTQTLRSASSVRDQCCLNESLQWCQISRGVKLALVWHEGHKLSGAHVRQERIITLPWIMVQVTQLSKVRWLVSLLRKSQ